MRNESLLPVVTIIRQSARLAVWLGMAMVAFPGGTTLAHVEHGHPAAIHEGSCEQLGKLAFRLNGVGGSVDVDNAPVATPTAVNPATSYQLVVSETTMDTPLAALLESDHALMVYESDEAMTAISCGNLGGAMLDNVLITGLAELGVPGHTGIAIFTVDGDTTQVEVILGHGLAPVSSAGAAGHAHQEETEDGAHGSATPTP